MDKYVDYDDLARLEYGRMLWRDPGMRKRLRDHWTDPRHPYRERFLAHRERIERLLESPEDDASVEDELTSAGTSLRAVMREIPPVFGSFWPAAGRF